jgi:hypothetical protein
MLWAYRYLAFVPRMIAAAISSIVVGSDGQSAATDPFNPSDPVDESPSLSPVLDDAEEDTG